MKYNRKEIMKRAWEIKKEDNRNLFSICLKMAWEEAKGMKKENGKESIAKEIVAEAIRCMNITIEAKRERAILKGRKAPKCNSELQDIEALKSIKDYDFIIANRKLLPDWRNYTMECQKREVANFYRFLDLAEIYEII